MEIPSKYTLIFNSDELTVSKYKEIYNLAVDIRDYKNMLSKEVFNDLFRFLNMTNYDFCSFMTKRHKGEISSNFYKQANTHVYTCYQNKFEQIQQKVIFESIQYKGINLYKKNTKSNKKGDFKSVKSKTYRTELTSTLTYLARYGNNNTVDSIKNRILIEEDDKKSLYLMNILNKIEKYGFARLIRLAKQKRVRYINKYNTKQVEFEKLTFGGRCRKSQIVGFNKNYNSCIKAFVSLSWANENKTMEIPVKYAKRYHGDMKRYLKKRNDYEYLITLNEKDKEVNVNICKDGDRYIPDNKNNYIGIDVNVKNNLFSLSNNKTFDYDRQLVKDYTKLCLELDSYKEANGKYKVGRYKQYKLNKLREKMLKSNQQLIAAMCKGLKESGYDHIVMENLNNGFGKSFAKKEDINFNRIVKFLKLSSLKNEVEHIARNYDISISMVHPAYTSKMCPKCGCIEDGNRKTQEDFCCVECGHTDNADHNASVNIENRVLLTVLRDKLLKQTDNNAYIPIPMKTDRIKEVLLSCRYTT